MPFLPLNQQRQSTEGSQHSMDMIEKDRMYSEFIKLHLIFIDSLCDIISVLQQNRLQWYGPVLQKEDNDWVKNVCSMK